MEDVGTKFERDHPLLMLSKIVRLGQQECVGNIHVAWFQLYARLQTAQPPQDLLSRFGRAMWGLIGRFTKPEGLLRPLDWVTDILMEAEQCAPRPFLRPSAPCLEYPSSTVLDVHTLGCKLTQVRCLPNGDIMACGYERHNGSITIAVMVAQASSATETYFLLVRSVCFSAKGMRIVSGSDDRTVRLWDAATGEQIVSLEGHKEWVRSVCFSADGTRIVSGSYDRTVLVCDATGEKTGTALKGHKDWVRSVCFSADGTRIVSGSDDRTVRVWDATTSEHVSDALNGHTAWVRSVCFNADGTRILPGSNDCSVRMWDASTGEQVGAALEGHSDWVRSMCFSADGRRIVSGSNDCTVRVWDMATGEQIGVALEGHTDWVSSVRFSADGTRIVSGSDDCTVHVWDAATGVQVCATLDAQAGRVTKVAINGDGTRIVSWSEGSGADDTVRLWNVDLASVVKVLHLSDAAAKVEAESEAEHFLSVGIGNRTGLPRVFVTDGRAVLLESGGSGARRVAAFDDGIYCACVSGDGCSVGVGLMNGVVAIMHVEEDN